MSNSLPYVTSPGNIEKALNAIKAAAVPDKVTQDFVKTILKIKGGSGDQMTSLLKKLGFSETNGTPTERYKKFRNPTTSGRAMAEAIRHAYAPLFEHNEYVFELSDEDVLGLIVEITGQAHDAGPVKLTLTCFKNLKAFADFSKAASPEPVDVAVQSETDPTDVGSRFNESQAGMSPESFGLNLGYTININLPATDDVKVFDAIFKSIKRNLMSKDDA